MRKSNLLLCLLVVGACLTVQAAETVKLNGLYYSLGTTTAALLADQSSDKSVYSAYTTVTIPSSVTYKNYTYPVTSIGTSAFEGCSNLQSVTLPSSVTSIGTDAFWGCTKLGSVNLEEGLTTINQRAFYNCNLTEITIPSTVTSVGNGAFKGNPLTSVVWKPVTCNIGSDDSAPFYSTNSQITSFTFGDQVEEIPSYLCKNMSKLTEVVLPPSVYKLGQYAFMYCTSLKSINLPVTQKTLPVSFFEGCTALESVEIPSTLTTISMDAFYNCKALKSIVLPAGLTTIGDRAFYNCTGLQTIYNYAIEPQTITEKMVNGVDKKTCILYVPMDYLPLYQAKTVWCDFLNIIGMITEQQFEEQQVNLTYLKQDETPLFMESQTWAIPHAPYIQGFVFEKWEVIAGDLNDGIVLQAVYKQDEGTGAPAVYTNPANAAQKLIRRGNGYILRDDKTYTIGGTRVE
ncbi:MAG: leucine-rich repeat domain-containing protein [Paludibacteraceae bacterium]|nr:leucine-rich repeat domain-containing protein [Paludibacteraceae bacterium]